MKKIARMAEQLFTQFSDHSPLLLNMYLPTDVSVKSKRPPFSTTTYRLAQHPISQKRENQKRTQYCWDNDSAANVAHSFKTLTMTTAEKQIRIRSKCNI